MSLKAQPYIFRRFFLMQYLSIYRLRPIFISLKSSRMQEMGLIFQKFPGGACPQSPPHPHPSIASRLRRLLTSRLWRSSIRGFAAHKYALPKTRPIENCFRRACNFKTSSKGDGLLLYNDLDLI